MDTSGAKTFAIHTLGCKVNTYESDLMAESLRAAGLSERDFTECADIYIVNTCTVTSIADKKSRQMLRRARKLNPLACIVAAGCFVDDAKRNDTLRELIEDGVIDIALPNSAKSLAAELILGDAGYRAAVNADDDAFSSSPRIITSLGTHTRAFIKVQDGCNMFCSYCIIPYVRGKIYFRAPEEVLSEIRSLAGAGTAEVVLTGIHLSSMGDRLLDLIEKAAEIDGIKRVRLSSLEPNFITKERAKRLSAIDKLCPHFHLSLQSGSDRILSAMNRHYTTSQYLLAVEILREHFEHPAITTDIIVGFPGETEEDFSDTLLFARKVGFYEAHVFKYSPRPSTPAADMPGQLSDAVKSKRSKRLIELSFEMSEKFKEYYIGKKIAFLSEELISIDGLTYETGYTPEYVRALKQTDTLHQNEIIPGTASGLIPLKARHKGKGIFII